ncbi:hypothetical protein GCM10020367_66270 [Streptomyces sannanensis]|uniref:Integral membrane protein n=1 Tax=Streptomyces sannanensis TaxID=285536 RepID=A0ABP6SLL8_9ACTN
MDIAALAMWAVTALGGFYMLATWFSRGGPHSHDSRLPVPVVFGHFALAAAGLVVWILYVISDAGALAWTAFGLLVPVVLLGLTLLVRWIPVYRRHVTAQAGGADSGPVEAYFPVTVVAGHGLAAVTTVVLVLLTASGIGG